MSDSLTINKGSKYWWLSPDIWVQPSTDLSPKPPGVGHPVAGETYNVWVRLHDYDSDKVEAYTWDMFVCWIVPTAGPHPFPPSTQQLYTGPIRSTVPAGSKGLPVGGSMGVMPITWTPAHKNHGHECLIAAAWTPLGGYPAKNLDGNSPTTVNFTIAQKNLGVLKAAKHMRRFQYAFQACNGADEIRQFVITAQQGTLSDIEAFLPGMPAGESILQKPGQVEGLGIIESAQPDPAQLDAATAVLSSVTIGPRSCQPFTLVGSLQEGNALIHVTESLGEEVVGGLSVLVLAE